MEQDFIRKKAPVSGCFFHIYCMSTFVEFLNAQPDHLQQSWGQVEVSWRQFLGVLRQHLNANMNKYDAMHSKFGDLASEHPDKRIGRIVKMTSKKLAEVKESLQQLSAHEMI